MYSFGICANCSASCAFNASTPSIAEANGDLTHECNITIVLVVTECKVMWGKKEVVSKREERTGLQAVKNWFSSCPFEKFSVVKGTPSRTWRGCSEQADASHLFTWKRKLNEEFGSCALISIVNASTTEADVKKCLKDGTNSADKYFASFVGISGFQDFIPRNLHAPYWVSYTCLFCDVPAAKDEVAVSGFAEDEPTCTSCLVGEWSETVCDSWCEGGLVGRYRSITMLDNLEYCIKSGDPACDKCPHLWEAERCNSGVSCGKASHWEFRAEYAPLVVALPPGGVSDQKKPVVARLDLVGKCPIACSVL